MAESISSTKESMAESIRTEESSGSSLVGAIVAFCNPLLDVSATVDEAFLARYGLEANNAILADESAGSAHGALFEEVAGLGDAAYTAGGSAQNALRAAQWKLPAGSTVFVGCVGRDAHGALLGEIARGDGLTVEYMVDDEGGAPTGICACLISGGGRSRSLVAKLGAANAYRLDHLLHTRASQVRADGAEQSLMAVVEAARVVYISGFFLTVSPATALCVATRCEARREGGAAAPLVALNVSAPFICEFFRDALLALLPHVDYIFGNEAEAGALGRALGLPDCTPEGVARHLAGARPGRRVVITQGAGATIVAQPAAACVGGEAFAVSIEAFAVAPIPAAEVVDTNGAGDAFVGAFLAALVRGAPVAACVAEGHACARLIIGTSGVSFPRPAKGGQE